jgi:LacI family transcriptional regulator
VIDRLWQQGVYTATVVTDTQPSRRVVSVRGNGVCAGRMAAQMLSFLCPGSQVAIFSSSPDIAICRENLEGFAAQAQSLPLTVAHIYENHDDPGQARAAVEHMADHFPDVSGIYILSANSAAACRRLQQLGLGQRYAVVATDLFPEIHHYMERGIIRATLFQSPRRQGELVVHKLYEHIDQADPSEEVVLITPQLVLDSNRDQY